MSGRQPRLFGMNRYSVIQSEFTEDEKKKLIEAGISEDVINDPTKEVELRATYNMKPDTPDTSGGVCDGCFTGNGCLAWNGGCCCLCRTLADCFK